MPMPFFLVDQYAFLPTGSTTAALVSIIIHDTIELLSANDYVVVISMDYTTNISSHV